MSNAILFPLETADPNVELDIRRLQLPRLVALRLVRPSDADIATASVALGFDLPRAANRFPDMEPRVARLGPGEWTIQGGPSAQEIGGRLSNTTHSVSDETPGKAGWEIRGTKAADLIACGCSLDLHPTVFPAGACTRTLIARIPALIMRASAAPSFVLIVDLSFELYFGDWLADAARGFHE